MEKKDEYRDRLREFCLLNRDLDEIEDVNDGLEYFTLKIVASSTDIYFQTKYGKKAEISEKLAKLLLEKLKDNTEDMDSDVGIADYTHKTESDDEKDMVEVKPNHETESDEDSVDATEKDGNKQLFKSDIPIYDTVTKPVVEAGKGKSVVKERVSANALVLAYQMELNEHSNLQSAQGYPAAAFSQKAEAQPGPTERGPPPLVPAAEQLQVLRPDRLIVPGSPALVQTVGQGQFTVALPQSSPGIMQPQAESSVARPVDEIEHREQFIPERNYPYELTTLAQKQRQKLAVYNMLSSVGSSHKMTHTMECVYLHHRVLVSEQSNQRILRKKLAYLMLQKLKTERASPQQSKEQEELEDPNDDSSGPLTLQKWVKEDAGE